MLQTGHLGGPREEFVLVYAKGLTTNVCEAFPCSISIGEALAKLGAPEKGNFRTFINGEFVSDQEGWRAIHPEPGATVSVRLVPAYGLEITLMYIIIALAMVQMVLTLRAKQPRRDSQSRFDSPTLRGSRNRVAPHEPIPRIYGRMRYHPPLGAYTYTEIIGGDHYLRCLFVAGYGPLAIDVEDMRIGETPLTDFSGFEVEVLPGELTDPPLTLYPAQVTQDESNATLYNPGMATEDLIVGESPGSTGWVTRTTDLNTDEIGLEIYFPSGLGYVSAKGINRIHPVQFKIEYRAVGTSTWILVPQSILRLSDLLELTTPIGNPGAIDNSQIHCTQVRFGAFVTGVNFPVPQRGQYEVRIKNTFSRGITEGRTDSVVGECRLTVVKSFRNEAPWSLPGIAMVGLRIKATEQLQGTIEDFSIIARSKLRTWNGSAWTAPVETRNAAWVYADILRGSANPDPVDDSLIDADRLLEWAEMIEDHTTPNSDGIGQTNPMYFDGVIDYRTTVYRALSDVAAAARATPHMRDGLFSVVFDHDRTFESPVQMITPKNVVRGTFVGRKVFFEEAEGYRIGFKNEAKDYGDDEVLMFSDGFTADTARVYEKVEWLGITNQDRAIDETRFAIFERRYRPEVFRFEMDLENIVFERGDLVAFAHDVPLLGLSYGAISEVNFNVGGDVVSLVIEEECTFVTGTSYGVRIRRHVTTFDVLDSLAVVNPASGSDVTTKLLTFVTPLAAANAPSVGDHVSFGELGIETRRCIVKSISPQQDLTAAVELEDEGAAIFGDLTAPIPLYDPGINRPRDISPFPPEILDVTSDFKDIFVTIRLVSGFGRSVKRYELQVKTTEGAWESVQNVPAGGQVVAVITGLVLDMRYDIRVRSIGTNNLPSTWATRTGFYHASRPVNIERYAISNLTVENAIDDAGTFTGADIVISWELSFADGVAVDPFTDSTGETFISESEAERFEGYAVRILEATFSEALGVYVSGEVVEEVLVAAKTFSYTYDHNVDDGGPRRSVFLEVAAQIGGLRTPYSSTFASNPPPPLPDLLRLDGLNGSSIAFEIGGGNTDADWDGYVIWISEASGFAPRIDNVQFRGKLSGVLSVPAVPGTTYYVRYASFDKFSSDPAVLNLSAELSVTTGTVPGATLQAYDLAVARGTHTAVGFVLRDDGATVPPPAWTAVESVSVPSDAMLVKMHEDFAFTALYDGVLQIQYECWIGMTSDGGVSSSSYYTTVMTYSVDSIEDPADQLLLFRKGDRSNPGIGMPAAGSTPPLQLENYHIIVEHGLLDVVAGSTYYFSTWVGMNADPDGSLGSHYVYFDALTLRQIVEV